MGFVITPFENSPDTASLRDFPNYEINNLGEVFKVALKSGKRTKVKTYAHHVNGSCRVLLRKDGKRHSRAIADLMLIAFFPTPREGAVIEFYYRDKDPLNCSLDNLKPIQFS